MREFRKYKELNEVSNLFNDIITLSNILLKQRLLIINKNEHLLNCLRVVRSKAASFGDKNQILHLVVKDPSNKWVIRCLIVYDVLIAVLYEDNVNGIRLSGEEALNEINRICIQNPLIKYSVGVVEFTDVPENIRKHVEKVVEEYIRVDLPKIWLGRILYDILIDEIISDKGGFMYVLRGRDKLGRFYAVKIPRIKVTPSKYGTLDSRDESILNLFHGAYNSLEATLISREQLGKNISSLGYSEFYANQLIYYTKYILRPRAIVILKDTYSIEEYVENPPVIIEEYADKGDLATKIRELPLDLRESLFIGIRIAGALALAHAQRLLHMDVKPQNILFKSDKSEPYGYAPLLGDFIGTPHLLNSYIEIKKSTPEYAEPFSLIEGIADFSYDVYSLGMTLFSTLTRHRLRGRILVNLTTLKNMYGVDAPLKAFLIENPSMVSYSNTLEQLYKAYKNNKIQKTEFFNQLAAIIEEIDSATLAEVRKKYPSSFINIISRTLSLDKKERYTDAIALWIDLVKVARELGYISLIPAKKAS
ncbi:MAG: protein kinase [Thermoprotei archaeon]